MFCKNNFISKFSSFRFLSLFALILASHIYIYIYSVKPVSAYSASISTSGTVNLEVSASGNGANVATDNVTVISTCPSGYTVSIKGPVDSTLYKVNQTTGKADKTNNSTSSKIVPTMGTKDNPLPIIGDDSSGNSYLGTWGYSMTNNLATGTFIGLTNTMTELLTRTTGTTNLGETIPIYYGASILPTTEPGQYKLAESTEGAGDNVITYYLTTDPGCGEEPTILDISTMQEMTSAICAATPTGIEATLKDIRDDKTYVVAKLADNKCWMKQNLALGGSSAITLTPSESDVTANFTLEASSTAFGTTNDTAGVDINRVNSDFANHWLDGTTVNTTGTPPSQTQYVGNYYNWYTATAGKGTYSVSASNARVDESICPKGWRLPITKGSGSDSSNTDDLIGDVYGDYDSYISATSMILGGFFNGYYPTTAQYQGEVGAFWTNTAISNYQAYIVWTNASQKKIVINGVASKRIGQPVRCVARDTYTISFDANGGSGEMPAQIAYRDQATELNANTFTSIIEGTERKFLGWNTKPDGSGTSYTDKEAVTNLAGTNGSVVLYAQWKVTIANISTMQEMTSAICADSRVGDETTLRDVRDDKTYNIRKMEDGECWMTQNLALGDSTKDIVLTPDDTDLTVEFTLPASAVQTSGTIDWSTDYHALRVYDNGNLWINPSSSGGTTIPQTSGTPSSQSQYVGNYYNWFTATARSGTSSSANPSIGNMSVSICPKGWKLPTGGPNSDYVKFSENTVGITDNMNSTMATTLQMAPYHFIFAGGYNSGITGQGGAGVWWTSTGIAGGRAYVFNLVTNWVGPQVSAGSTQRFLGYSVRCVAR